MRKADAVARDRRMALQDADPDGTAPHAAIDVSRAAIARHFNELGVPTPSGRGIWSAATVSRLKARLAAQV